MPQSPTDVQINMEVIKIDEHSAISRNYLIKYCITLKNKN
ncbi:hypothetical protein FDUTEX481_03913 [Tolypothrix sp. PCC 7601]|nr:hypothetical protein FDUTEX481_03913 [Tolypothrix sp. PCC 7601]